MTITIVKLIYGVSDGWTTSSHLACLTLTLYTVHKRTGQIFLWGGGAEPSLPEKFFDSARKKLLC